MANLAKQKCVACESGIGKLNDARTRELLQAVPGWEIGGGGGGELRRVFKFKDYYEVMAFVNATAWVSHRQDHHPDLEVGYNQVTMRYSTHSAGGLTENDFICAAKVNELLDQAPTL